MSIEAWDAEGVCVAIERIKNTDRNVEFPNYIALHLLERLRDAESDLAKCREERKEIFWIMFQAFQLKLPVQYRERRLKPKAKWADCVSDPIWNWSDYEYRIKAEGVEG